MLAIRTLFLGAGLLLLTAAADATLNAQVSRPLPVAMAVGSAMYGAVALLPTPRIRAVSGRSASARVIGPASLALCAVATGHLAASGAGRWNAFLSASTALVALAVFLVTRKQDDRESPRQAK